MMLLRELRLIPWILLCGISLHCCLARKIFAEGGSTRPTEEKEAWFETQVRPVLIAKCLKCHGPDKQSGSLRLDTREAILEGGDQGPAVIPDNSGESLLIRAIRRTDDTLKMPPDEPLTPEEIQGIERWVSEGTVWPAGPGGSHPLVAGKHWAFVPVEEPVIPPDPSGWAAAPLDHYIAAQQLQEGLKPVADADRRMLIRRVTYDLLGFPPSPGEIEEFSNDSSPDAYPRLIDRLLSSPAYGERWGRHWMDVVRYADTAGDNADYPIPEIRLYRDYIIDSINQDRPYDQFVQEQLAGDILALDNPERRSELIVATGFIALSRRYATAPYELMHLTLEDTIDTVGRGLMGITFRCARCHDHKFDPVTMQDYYGLYSIFASTRYPYAGSEEYQSMNKPREGFIPLTTSEAVAQATIAHEKYLAEREQALKDHNEKSKPAIELREQDRKRDELIARLWDFAELRVETLPENWEQSLRQFQEEHEKLKQKRDSSRRDIEREIKALKQQGVPEGIPAAYAVTEGKVQDVPMQMKGEPAQPGPIAKRQVPRFIAGSEPVEFPESQSGRLQLARWLTHPRNPLFARVMVNRVWLEHFGKGLVGTPSNFGLRGEAPTHPQLLDYLAWSFMNQGWSLKKLHREILLSRTYQLSSIQSQENSQKDPGNRLYWRQDRRRLDAEALRDGMLLVSGLLDTSRPAEHPFPPPKKWNWTQHNPFRESYDSSHRSVYLMTQRLQRHPYLSLFDGPDTNSSVEKRTSATVPLQGLYLLNSPDLQKIGTGFANLILAQSEEITPRITWAYHRAYGRQPERGELQRAEQHISAMHSELIAAGVPETDATQQAWQSFARLLLISNEFLYID